MCVPHQVAAPPGPPQHPLLSPRHLELFTAWAYLFQSKAQLLRDGAGLHSSLHPAGPTACTEQALPSAGWKGTAPSPTPPHLNHFYLKGHPSHVHSI